MSRAACICNHHILRELINQHFHSTTYKYNVFCATYTFMYNFYVSIDDEIQVDSCIPKPLIKKYLTNKFNNPL